MTDAGAQKTLVSITRVAAIRVSDGTHIGFDVDPSAIQQWAHDAVRPHRLDARQPADAGASNHAQQHRFCLVVAGVAGGDA